MQQGLDITPPVEPLLLDALTELAARAAAAILAVSRSDWATRLKPDRSPVTAADEAAEVVILEGLSRLLPGVPVVSEENAGLSPSAAALGSLFLLVDPVDGTRELLAGRDEYAINIALISKNVPVLGIVAAPALGLVWRGLQGHAAQRLDMTRQGRTCGTAAAIRARAWPAQGALALVSRSHLDPGTSALLDRFPGIHRHPCGSAIKFCRLAEGSADIYPRLAPTAEWDVAAGHAVLAAAGGVMTTPSGRPLAYGRLADGFRVPGFIALGDPAAAPRLSPVLRRGETDEHSGD